MESGNEHRTETLESQKLRTELDLLRLRANRIKRWWTDPVVWGGASGWIAAILAIGFHLLTYSVARERSKSEANLAIAEKLNAETKLQAAENNLASAALKLEKVRFELDKADEAISYSLDILQSKSESAYLSARRGLADIEGKIAPLWAKHRNETPNWHPMSEKPLIDEARMLHNIYADVLINSKNLNEASDKIVNIYSIAGSRSTMDPRLIDGRQSAIEGLMGKYSSANFKIQRIEAAMRKATRDQASN